ncbi:uncharacterized protein CCOS01_16576 [Colletotrichum costaricense]|uniref:Uncharacterized protein n=1 Tax=Colletotrichum costaricense TaxID=1209916 RepID=A0AAI9YFN5_9PEZI|nr:uncharacterized protein CCOS01_16576 [Colletotrichum costaricense]KAK1506524.1 hypothetical protein CCOS01_16576 [Colletotrichum costaricense]
MRHLDTNGELCYLQSGPIVCPEFDFTAPQRDPGAAHPNVDKIFDLQDWSVVGGEWFTSVIDHEYRPHPISQVPFLAIELPSPPVWPPVDKELEGNQETDDLRLSTDLTTWPLRIGNPTLAGNAAKPKGTPSASEFPGTSSGCLSSVPTTNVYGNVHCTPLSEVREVGGGHVDGRYDNFGHGADRS